MRLHVRSCISVQWLEVMLLQYINGSFLCSIYLHFGRVCNQLTVTWIPDPGLLLLIHSYVKVLTIKLSGYF